MYVDLNNSKRILPEFKQKQTVQRSNKHLRRRNTL